nr:uncharacterized protein LOC124815161 [Hydra vulgaris]
MNTFSYYEDSKVKKFYDAIFELGAVPLINRPTRVSINTTTLIDSIITTDILNKNIQKGILKPDISDHFPIFLTFNCNSETMIKTSKKIRLRHINKDNINHFKEQLSLLHWKHINFNDDANSIYDNFFNTYPIYDANFPFIEKTINPKKTFNPWITKDFKKLSKIKQKLYINLIDKYKNNSKRTWEIIKEISGKQKDCSGFLPQVIKVDNRIIYEQKEIACEFNNFFVKVGPELANKIPKTQAIFSDFLVPMTDCITSGELSSKLSFEEFEIAFKTLKKNKATGADDINGNIILNCFEQLKDILFKVFSASINQGIFPEQLKIAKITPIFKEGDRAIISNYRPISILPIFSKILERIMYNRVYDYFQCNNLLYSNQFGFKKHNSTEHAIIQFVREISKSFENSQYTLGIFIDLSKAFDTVDHTILLHKLKYYGRDLYAVKKAM